MICKKELGRISRFRGPIPCCYDTKFDSHCTLEAFTSLKFIKLWNVISFYFWAQLFTLERHILSRTITIIVFFKMLTWSTTIINLIFQTSQASVLKSIMLVYFYRCWKEDSVSLFCVEVRHRQVLRKVRGSSGLAIDFADSAHEVQLNHLTG